MYTSHASCLLSDPVLASFDAPTAIALHASPIAGTAVVEDRFATMPTLTAAPAPNYYPINEEELHTSFEQAISERVLAVNQMLQHNACRVSKPLLPQTAPLAQSALRLKVEQEEQQELAEAVLMSEEPLQRQPRQTLPGPWLQDSWLRGLTYGGFALMLMLIGFDLMGLLIVVAR